VTPVCDYCGEEIAAGNRAHPGFCCAPCRDADRSLRLLGRRERQEHRRALAEHRNRTDRDRSGQAPRRAE